MSAEPWLTCSAPDGRAVITLSRKAKSPTPVLNVRIGGTLLISEDHAISKPKARESVVGRCPEELRAWVANALLELSGQWSTARPTETPGRSDMNRLTRDVDPWPESVDPRELLDALLAQLRRHIALPEYGDIIMTLWIAHTHFIEHLRFTPYLHLTSPTKACGKTTALELLELLTPRPWRISNPTAAVLFRTIESERPTLLLDEIDTIPAGEKFDALTGVLNDGWHVAGKVARCDGDDNAVKNFSCYSAKALAGIGATLKDATTSRCIRLPMARATGEALARLKALRTDRAEAWALPLRRQLARLALEAGPYVAQCLQEDDAVEMPLGVDGRDAQMWEPLLAIADLASEEWGAVARLACVALVEARRANDDGDVRVRLLGDVRAYFVEHDCHTASTRAIIAWLVEDESRGWADYRGKELTPEALARLLKPFGVGPKKVAASMRVWQRSDLEPVWEKYLKALAQPATPARPGTTVAAVARVAGVAGCSPSLALVADQSEDDGYLHALLAEESTLEPATPADLDRMEVRYDDAA